MDQRKETIEAAVQFAQDLFKGNAGGHDFAHTMRVYRLAMRIAEREAGCDRETVALAALLHDADDAKLFHTENCENARRFLESRGISGEKADRIIEAIRSVSFSKNRGKKPATVEGRIVQDADRLDAIGAIGIARTFAYGGEHGRTMEDTIRHFDEKLLLLKDEINTASAMAIAQERHDFMLHYLQELNREMNGEQPGLSKEKGGNKMEFNEVIRSRYSCKKYSGRPVEDEKLNAILEAGRLAPTAKNLQEQHVYVVRSGEVLKKIDAVTPCRYGAPVVLVVTFERENVFTYPGGKRDSGAEDAAIVATHMMLAAVNEGLDSCWLNYFDPEKMAQALNLPENEEVLMALDLGYAAPGSGPLPNHLSRKPLTDTVSYL